VGVKCRSVVAEEKCFLDNTIETQIIILKILLILETLRLMPTKGREKKSGCNFVNKSNIL